VTDSALRHLRDALVLCQAAVEELAAVEGPAHGVRVAFDASVRARLFLRSAIESMEAGDD
jgi:hypothetical protein